MRGTILDSAALDGAVLSLADLTEAADPAPPDAARAQRATQI